MIEGNDGGACVSFNGGQSWSSIYNQPTAQLYHVTTDDRFPYRVYASQQDNTAISIPSCSPIGAITERDWIKPGGGESGYIAIKPDDPDYVVASGPIGRRFTNDIMYLHDHKTQQDWQNTVWPELYGWGVGAETLKYRFNWTFPIHYSRHDPDVLWVALAAPAPLDRPRRELGGDEPGPDAQRPLEARPVRRADHARQHRRRGLLHDLRAGRVAAAPEPALVRHRRRARAPLRGRRAHLDQHHARRQAREGARAAGATRCRSGR